MPFYAVTKGRREGIYETWAECEEQVSGFSNARFRRFNTFEDARDYFESCCGEYCDYDSDSSSCYSYGDNTYGEVYTDGCCLNNGRDGARAGVGIFWGHGDSRNFSGPLYGKQTNNRAEIVAAVIACQQAKSHGIKHLTILTDSQFLIDSQVKWLEMWKAREWKRSDGQPLVNTNEFWRLEDAKEGLEVQWVHVPAHNDVEGNEEADRLANLGAQMY